MLWRRMRPRVVEAAPGEVELLKDTATELRGELARADSKASMLLALSGAVAAVVASGGLLAGHGVGVWLARAGLALLVVVVAVLLATVRPKLAGAPFVRVLEPGWRPESPRERVENLSAVARSKFTRIRLAVDVLAVAVVLLGSGVAVSGVAS